MAKYNHIIEDWWRHLGTYDREQVIGLDCHDVQQFLTYTDIWWSGLSYEEKEKIYEDFFDES